MNALHYNSRITIIFCLAVSAYPIFWIIGLSAFYTIIVVSIISMHVIKDKLFYVRSSALLPITLLILYILTYGLSLIVNASSANSGRVFAGLYNLLIWCVGLIAFWAGSQADIDTLRKRIPLAALVVLTSLAFLSAVAAFLWYVLNERYVRIDTPFSALLGAAPTHLIVSSTLGILESDWRFGDFAPRTRILGPYPTATAATVLLLSPFIFLRKWRGIVSMSILIFCISFSTVGFIFSFSRTAFLGAVVGLAVSLLILKPKIIVYYIVLMPLILLLGAIYFADIADNFLSIRAGSSDHRLALYEYQINEVLRRSPLIGLGLKDRVDYFNVPIGSHSTYMGGFYKTGIIGIFLIVSFVITLFHRMAFTKLLPNKYRTFNACVCFAVVSIAIWMIAEDIDAPQFVSFVFFYFCGVLFAPTFEDSHVRASSHAGAWPDEIKTQILS